ncbi:Leo1 domain containing protein [Pyrenophora tritici-repentis]|nr:Leo1 domain containing protein [Pyrenophora tritici-repentis]
MERHESLNHDSASIGVSPVPSTPPSWLFCTPQPEEIPPNPNNEWSNLNGDWGKEGLEPRYHFSRAAFAEHLQLHHQSTVAVLPLPSARASSSGHSKHPATLKQKSQRTPGRQAHGKMAGDNGTSTKKRAASPLDASRTVKRPNLIAGFVMSDEESENEEEDHVNHDTQGQNSLVTPQRPFSLLPVSLQNEPKFLPEFTPLPTKQLNQACINAALERIRCARSKSTVPSKSARQPSTKPPLPTVAQHSARQPSTKPPPPTVTQHSALLPKHQRQVSVQANRKDANSFQGSIAVSQNMASSSSQEASTRVFGGLPTPKATESASRAAQKASRHATTKVPPPKTAQPKSSLPSTLGAAKQKPVGRSREKAVDKGKDTPPSPSTVVQRPANTAQPRARGQIAPTASPKLATQTAFTFRAPEPTSLKQPVPVAEVDSAAKTIPKKLSAKAAGKRKVDTIGGGNGDHTAPAVKKPLTTKLSAKAAGKRKVDMISGGIGDRTAPAVKRQTESFVGPSRAGIESFAGPSRAAPVKKQTESSAGPSRAGSVKKPTESSAEPSRAGTDTPSKPEVPLIQGNLQSVAVAPMVPNMIPIENAAVPVGKSAASGPGLKTGETTVLPSAMRQPSPATSSGDSDQQQSNPASDASEKSASPSSPFPSTHTKGKVVKQVRFATPDTMPTPSAEPYFEYSIFHKTWSTPHEESTATTTEISVRTDTDIDVANAQAKKVYNAVRASTGPSIEEQSSKLDANGCAMYTLTHAHPFSPSQKTHVHFFVKRYEASKYAGRTVDDLDGAKVISNTAYADTDEALIRTASHSHVGCPDVYTTLSSANRAALALQIRLSHEEEPKNPLTKDFQERGLRALQEKLQGLSVKEGDGQATECWVSQFNAVGRDCGDHSGCKKDKSKKSESGSEDSKKQKKKTKKEKRKEEKKEEKKRKESFQGLKDDLLDALDSRFHDMNKAHQQQQPTSTTPPQPPHPFGGPGMGPSPFTMGGPHHMDPRIAQQMGMMGGEGYRMG